jgi:hypothetical protein
MAGIASSCLGLWMFVAASQGAELKGHPRRVNLTIMGN